MANIAANTYRNMRGTTTWQTSPRTHTETCEAPPHGKHRREHIPKHARHHHMANIAANTYRNMRGTTTWQTSPRAHTETCEAPPHGKHRREHIPKHARHH